MVIAWGLFVYQADLKGEVSVQTKYRSLRALESGVKECQTTYTVLSRIWGPANQPYKVSSMFTSTLLKNHKLVVVIVGGLLRIHSSLLTVVTSKLVNTSS